MEPTTRRGITLMETVIGALLVGGVLASTLRLIGPTVGSSLLAGDEVVAAQIADTLLDEITCLAYRDPTDNNGLIGVNTGESARSTFDDVDDYNKWSATPQSKAGVVRPGLNGAWIASVAVRFAPEADPNGASLTDTGIKHITVTVTRNGVVLATRRVFRTRSFDTARGAL